MLEILTGTAAATVEAATQEATLNDAVHELVENPEQTLSALGKFFQDLLNSILGAIPTILFAVLILVIGLFATKLALWLLSKGLNKTKLDLTVTKFVSQVTKIVLYVLLVTIILSILGIPATSIVTIIGTAGVAIGLALQDSLSNVAGGFLLLVTKPFKIGDYIIVNGVEGTVVQISILHTRLDSASNQAIFIPNGQAVNAVVINNCGNDTRRVDMTFSISYEEEFEKARKVILDVLKANPKVDKTRDITVRMLEHGASAIVIAVRPWCRTADYWDVYFDTTEQIRAAFIANNIEIPFDQLDVHVVNEKPEG
ncbi:MAG: mechanosensitive ion channel family protein [Oscillospiraceae bacterium]